MGTSSEFVAPTAPAWSPRCVLLGIGRWHACGVGRGGVARWKGGPEDAPLTCALPPQDKAVRRFTVRNMIESAAIRDMSEASVYKGASRLARDFTVRTSLTWLVVRPAQSTFSPSSTSRSTTASPAPSTRTSSVCVPLLAAATVPPLPAFASTRTARRSGALTCSQSLPRPVLTRFPISPAAVAAVAAAGAAAPARA